MITILLGNDTKFLKKMACGIAIEENAKVISFPEISFVNNECYVLSQPEQAEQADALIKIATNTDLVITTHSEVFVTRLRLLIAQNVWPHDQIKILWCKPENYTVIYINKFGGLSTYPNKMFDTIVHDLAALLRTRIDIRKNSNKTNESSK